MNSSDADTSVESINVGKSSTSTLASVLSGQSVSVATKKEKNAAKKKSILQKRKEKKRQKKIEQNKISKDDFYSKHTEFRTWLWEEKTVKFEDLNVSKAKDHFKKFIKKWNSKKLPKHYYRGIVSSWFDGGTPVTQTLWAMPKQFEMTPGSVREEVLDIKYSRAATDSKLCTFGKKEGAMALKQLQSMFSANFNDEIKDADKKQKTGACDNTKEQSGACENTKSSQVSSSSLPEISSTRSGPRPPRRTCSLSNMSSSKLTIFEDGLSGKENVQCSSTVELIHINTKGKKRSNTISTSMKQSDTIFNSPNKLQKQNCYITEADSPSHTTFNTLRIQSGKKLHSATCRTRPVSADSSTLFHDFTQQSRRRNSSSCNNTMQAGTSSDEVPAFRCATLRHSGYLSVHPSSSFDALL